MSAIQKLYELQEIDLDIDQKTQALEQLKSQIGKDEDVVEARSALEDARKYLTNLDKQQRSFEAEIDEISLKISKEEKKLYDGSGKNPKELVDLQKEVDLIKQKRSSKEDELLVIMENVDSAQQVVSNKTNALTEIENKWQEEQQKLLAEQKELEASLEALQQRKAPFLEQLDKTNIRIYEELRITKQGRAVAKVEQARCMGCRMSLPISDQQKARAGQELAMCSNCGRILCMI